MDPVVSKPSPKSGRAVVAVLLAMVGAVVVGMFLIAPSMADAVMERQTAPTEMITRTPSTVHKVWAPLGAPQGVGTEALRAAPVSPE